MLWPPPASTLFPYTTLFRSWFEVADPVADVAADSGAVIRELPHGRQRAVDRIRERRVRVERGQVSVDREHQRRPDEDRKSTRLNSSHITISYAVFCLKKKKT